MGCRVRDDAADASGAYALHPSPGLLARRQAAGVGIIGYNRPAMGCRVRGAASEAQGQYGHPLQL
jgi:hypothetical protein